MQNAHLRLGLLEYHASQRRHQPEFGEGFHLHRRGRAGASDRRLRKRLRHRRHYRGSSRKGQLHADLSDGTIKEITLGEHASCYRSSVILPGRKHPVRHLVAISEQLHANGSAGRTILSRNSPNEAWAWLSTFLGLPAVPEWAKHICGILESEGRFQPLGGIGCEPVLVTATADEMIAWISSALKSCEIAFPEENGPIKWPKYTLFETLRQIPEKDEQ